MYLISFKRLKNKQLNVKNLFCEQVGNLKFIYSTMQHKKIITSHTNQA